MEPRILSMEVDSNDHDSSFYRIWLDGRIRYVEVEPHAIDQDIKSFPLDTIVPVLRKHDDSPPSSNPESATASWTTATISLDRSNGQLQARFSHETLVGVQCQWSSTKISCLDFERTKQLTGSTFEATLSTERLRGLEDATMVQPSSDQNSDPTNPASRIHVIAKIARFDWEIPSVERETKAYRLLEQLRHTHNAPLAPRFLGHIHEHGRVIGFALEKIEGARHASIADLELCQAVLRDLHQSLGILHGDVNRYNFLITNHDTVRIRMIDFEHSREHASVEDMRREFDALESELLEDTQRGGGFHSDHDED